MGIDVTGGAGGVGAALEDLSAAAHRLADTAAETTLVASVVLRTALSADLVSAALVCPAGAARLAAGLADLAGPRGLGGEAVALAALAAGVRSAVAAYAAGEEAVALLVESAQDALVFLLSRQAVPLVGGALALQRGGVDVTAGADRLLFAAPWLVDLAGGAEGAVAGPVPVLGYEDALVLLARAASSRGWLSEAGRQVRVSRLAPPHHAGAPVSVADLVAAQADLEGPSEGAGSVRVVQVPQADGSSEGAGSVRVVQVPQADGSSAWVVVVPGTQEWSPQAGANPSDLTSDVLLMAGQSSLLVAGVERALALAQGESGRAGLGDPVLLAGHSQGGIVAAALASDPGFRRRQHVTHVVASGAPIARMRVPPEVSVLAVEHRQDAVPRLEGQRNGDRRGWLTVTRDLTGDPAVRGAGAAHDSRLYRETAALADTSGSRSLAQWREGSAAFLSGSAHGTPTVRDYRVERVGPVP